MRTLSLALAMLIVLCTQAAYAAPTCTRAAVFPASGNIPADHLRLLYFPSSSLGLDVADDAGVTLPLLYRLEGTTKVGVPYEVEPAEQGVWLTPTIEQPLGTQLVLETDPRCEADAPLHVTYSITEQRPHLPTELGTLSASVQRALIPIASEDDDVADVAYADLYIDLSHEALPFASLWRYQLYVDGEPRGSAPGPQGLDRVYAQCGMIDAGIDGANAVSPGVHTVHFAAQLDDELPLESPDLQIELRCDGLAPTTTSVAAAPSAETSCALASRGDGSWLLILLALVRRRAQGATGSLSA